MSIFRKKRLGAVSSSGRTKSLFELAQEAESEENSSALQECADEATLCAIEIKLSENDELSIFDSKLGGLPYWDSESDYPTGENNNKLSLLLQINLDSANIDDERLPNSGMLQFFIDEDIKNENAFRVVYHEKIDYNIKVEDVARLYPPVMPSEASPIKRSALLSFEKKNDTLSDSDGNKLFGYPFFCQEDVRQTDESGEYLYDTLLLQLTSDLGDNAFQMWGDSGVAHFFIPKTSLEKNDFSDVLFSWECY